MTFFTDFDSYNFLDSYFENVRCWEQAAFRLN